MFSWKNIKIAGWRKNADYITREHMLNTVKVKVMHIVQHMKYISDMYFMCWAMCITRKTWNLFNSLWPSDP